MGERDDPSPRVGEFVVEVLGGCRVRRTATGEQVPMTPLQRRILARLAAADPDGVSVDALIEATWPERPPTTARAALQNQVSRLRRATMDGLIVTEHAGYRLGVPTDAAQVRGAVRAAEHRLRTGDHQHASDLADAAVTRFRGTPFEDLADLPDLEGARRPMASLLLAAEGIRLAAAVALGDTTWAITESERLLSVHPTHEGLWVHHVRALEQAGRRGDALAAIDRVRQVLRHQLGLDIGPDLQRLERSVLSVHGRTALDHQQPVRGRDSELDQIIDAARSGDPVVVVADDGLGKSTVAGEVARRLRAAGIRVARATGHENPAQPLPVLSELLAELGTTFEAALGPIDGFVTAVGKLATTTPVALVVDDLHLEGPSTMRALERCAASPAVALVATAARRAGIENQLPSATTIELGPLDDVVIAQIVLDHLPPGADTSELQAEDLIAACGGNPFIARCLLDDGAPQADLERDRLASAALADFVRRRLDHLDSAARHAVEAAAVCGSPTARPVLAALTVEQGIDAAVAAGALRLVTDDTVAFSERVVERVVYADLTPGRRAELHHVVAQLEQQRGAPNSSIAHHLLAAAEVDPAAACTAALAAGHDASARGAHRDAASWFERAGQAAVRLGAGGSHLGLRARIAHGDALRLDGDARHATLLLDVAHDAEVHGDPELFGDAAYALLQLGGTTESGSVHQQAIEIADRALLAVEGTEQWAVVAAAASLAQSLTGNATHSRECFIRAEAAASSPEVRRLVLPFTYLGLGLPGDLPRRGALAQELHRLGSDLDDPVALFESHHLGLSVSLQLADGAAVRAHLAAMDALVERVGDIGRRWQLRYATAAVAHLDDDLAHAEALATDALALFSPVSESRAFAAFGSQLMVLRLAQGRVGELRDTLEVLVEEQPTVPAWHAALALVIVGDDPRRSAACAEGALRLAEPDFTWLPLHLLGARAACRLDDDLLAARYQAALQPWSGLVGWQGTCAFGPVDTALALLARRLDDADGAVVSAQRALDQARSLDAPVFQRELVELGLLDTG